MMQSIWCPRRGPVEGRVLCRKTGHCLVTTRDVGFQGRFSSLEAIASSLEAIAIGYTGWFGFGDE